jgi:hypothetical protein
MDNTTAKCARCGYVRVARGGSLSAECPMCVGRPSPAVGGDPIGKTPSFARDLSRRVRGIKPVWAILAATAIGIVALFVAVDPDRNLSPENRRYNDDWYRIRDNCRTAIGAQLHDRNSVEWGAESATGVGDTYVVNYEFRAKNGFGAYRLTSMACVIDQKSLRVISIIPTK